MGQENKQKYPRIYLLAMDILPIQASSVPCERVFSSGKETMAPCQCCIKPAFMEKLQMLKYSIRKEDSLNFTAGLRWTDELLELEDLQNNLPPTDLLLYRGSLQVVEDDGDEDWEDEDEDDDDGGCYVFIFSFSIYTMPSSGIELCYRSCEDWEVSIP